VPRIRTTAFKSRHAPCQALSREQEARTARKVLSSEQEARTARKVLSREQEERGALVLDVHFDEDDSRVRPGNAQANLVAVRYLALSVLKRDVSVNGGVGTKRFRAGLVEAFLLRLLKS
jgi:hypothetical protein